MNFDELQSNWQQQKAPETSNVNLDYASVMGRIVKLQRQTIIAGILISISFAFVFVGMGIMWNKFGQNSWYYHIGASLIFLDMIAALGFVWSLVISWKNKTVNLDSFAFISQTIQKLYRRKWLNRIVIPIYLVLLVVGINLIYLETQAQEPLNERIFTHLIVSICTFGGGMLAVYAGRKKDRERIDPLIIELEEIKAGMENGTEK